MGYAYSSPTAGIVLMDLGTGNGFLLGYKIVQSNMSDIVGEYKFIDVDDSGGKGAGHFSINAVGEVSFSRINTTGELISWYIANLIQHEQFPNIYKAAYTEFGGELYDFYLVILDDFLMYFLTDEYSMVSYGTGGQI